MEIIIRKANETDLEDIIKVHVSTWESSYRSFVPSEYIEAFIKKTKDKVWREQLRNIIGKNIFYLAEIRNQIIGFAIGGSVRSKDLNYMGELMGIYILKQHQRKGLGKALTHKIVEELLKMDINTMVVWVLANNPYRSFYDSLGGRIVKKKKHEILKLPVVAYGYDNLNDLIKKV
jgi:GNAT superfamily N-acetyltransferase